MTGYRWSELLCDGCDTEFKPIEPCSLADARDEARIYGWHRVGPGYDICEECWDRGIRSRVTETVPSRGGHSNVTERID